ncbi:MAG: diacylglycerol kinase family protein [Bacteroidales bacterium]
MQTIHKKKHFSLKDRLKSFVYAFNGIKYVIASQHNIWIHIVISILVLFLAFIFKLNNNEWIAIILAMGIVFSAEVFNSALELLVDFISPDYNEKAGKIKDIAAAAVLLAAIAAAITGCIIFTPYFFHLFKFL